MTEYLYTHTWGARAPPARCDRNAVGSWNHCRARAARDRRGWLCLGAGAGSGSIARPPRAGLRRRIQFPFRGEDGAVSCYLEKARGAEAECGDDAEPKVQRKTEERGVERH